MPGPTLAAAPTGCRRAWAASMRRSERAASRYFLYSTRRAISPSRVSGSSPSSVSGRRRRAREQILALDPHEGGGHDEEIARHLDVQRVQGSQILQVLPRDPRDGDLPDLHLVPLDEVQEQIQRSLECLEVDRVAPKLGGLRFLHALGKIHSDGSLRAVPGPDLRPDRTAPAGHRRSPRAWRLHAPTVNRSPWSRPAGSPLEAPRAIRYSVVWGPSSPAHLCGWRTIGGMEAARGPADCGAARWTLGRKVSSPIVQVSEWNG